MNQLSETDMVRLMDGHAPPDDVEAQREYYRVAALRIAEHYPEVWSRRLLAGSIPYSLHIFRLKHDHKRQEVTQ